MSNTFWAIVPGAKNSVGLIGISTQSDGFQRGQTVKAVTSKAISRHDQKR